MYVEEVLQLADELVFANTGKHLDDLQRAILKGVCQGQKYAKIAEDFHCSEGHVKDAGSDLWKILSEALKESISKANFRATIERLYFSNLSNFGKDMIQIANINVYGENSQTQEVRKQSHSHQDLGDAPELTAFYGRNTELITLQHWVTEDRCRVVTILGIVGIGKTALCVKFIQQIQAQFDYIFWRSLGSAPPLETLEKDLLKFLSDRPETEIATSAYERRSQLLDFLRYHRCLIILDDLQAIFAKEQLAGNYRSGYEEYGNFFQTIAEISHQSCFLLNSWEPLRELTALAGKTAPIKLLQLKGLDGAAIEILTEKELLEPEKYLSLIQAYQGNPLWLKIIATFIQEVFSGKISDFYQYGSLFLSEDLIGIFHQQWQRLSKVEKQVLSDLATADQRPYFFSELLAKSQLSSTELCSAIHSLKRRSWIENNKQGAEILFAIAPVMRHYLNRTLSSDPPVSWDGDR